MKEEQQAREISVRILIIGHVQGVGFRQSARKRAHQLGIEAKAINRDDGSVLLETTGPKEIVGEFIDWARIGPDLARVDDITVISTSRRARGFA